ncbi:hypothetical protein E2C01_049926 [Portunus trituberculatus]|uniref:Uncharacterized protein n=1 Tax=Portunus trituberculatus TaxID=210409 RepID=A0A5B7GF99_PORTR|nr:hypothetical protein [Portunus trituberculatus]
MVSVLGRRPRVGSNLTTYRFEGMPFVEWFKVTYMSPRMRLGGDIGPKMGTTMNKIPCATNGQKLNSASHIYLFFKYSYRRYRP